jgi:hypothetical protein
MLKSIGRSSHFWAKKLLAALSPRNPFPARLFIAPVQRGGGGRRGIDRSGDASYALTFPPSNHSFIQLFEMQLRQFALVA